MNREEALALAERGVEELIAALEQGKSERLLEYLAFQARFHRYSFNNCLLIAIQKPDATFAAGFQRWKELARFVRKGEKGIMIPRDEFCNVFTGNDFSHLPLEVCTHVCTQSFPDEQLARLVAVWPTLNDEKKAALVAATAEKDR
jgi:hypothetical protein